MSDVRCRCGFMVLWDPAVTYRRGVIDHSATKCEATCEGCKDRESDLAALRAGIEALAGEWERIAREQEARAEEWRRASSDHSTAIGLEALAQAHRSDAASLRALLPGGDAVEMTP